MTFKTWHAGNIHLPMCAIQALARYEEVLQQKTPEGSSIIRLVCTITCKGSGHGNLNLQVNLLSFWPKQRRRFECKGFSEQIAFAG